MKTLKTIFLNSLILMQRLVLNGQYNYRDSEGRICQVNSLVTVHEMMFKRTIHSKSVRTQGRGDSLAVPTILEKQNSITKEKYCCSSPFLNMDGIYGISKVGCKTNSIAALNTKISKLKPNTKCYHLQRNNL